MHYNIITPITRIHNFETLKNMIESQNYLHLTWHLLLDHDNSTTIDRKSYPNWIKWHRFNNNYTDCDKGHTSINSFLDATVLNANERYNILCDDDAYELAFFQKLNRYSSKVIICSMERGKSIPTGLAPIKSHPTTKLWACKEAMKVCHVGMEQLVISGDLLSKYRIPSQMWGDGMLIEKIVAENHVDYAPEISVLFNYYEPGRWK